MTGSILVMGIIILINLLVVIGVLYFGTREHHDSHVSASDSTAAVAWGKLAKNSPIAQATVEQAESVSEDSEVEATEADSEVADESDDAEIEAED